jgi:hypothetical protein
VAAVNWPPVISADWELVNRLGALATIVAKIDISLWHNIDKQPTWGWFLRFQTVHQRQVVPELTNKRATFSTVHAVDSDVEANSKIKIKIRDSK